MNIFIDSSFLVALIYPEDINHQTALLLGKKYSNNSYCIDHLIKYESINVLLRKGDVLLAKRLNRWLNKEKFRHLHLGDETWNTAFRDLIKNFSINGPNIFDHLHFATMREYYISDVLTFEKHFAKFGFNILK